MSDQNVEIARRLHPAFNGGDVDEVLSLLDPEVEWIPIMAALEGRVYRGHAGVRQWMEDLATDWEVFETHPEEFRDLGERVLILGCWRARGRASGVELQNEPASWLLDLKDGKVVRLQTFTDRDEALAAAGFKKSA